VDDWHDLLDGLVTRKGGLATLAAMICKATGRNSERDFETARRNLLNWTSGRAVPQRRNFALLTQLLDVASDPDVLARWNALYAAARLPEETAAGTMPSLLEGADAPAMAAAPGSKPARRPFLFTRWRVAASIAIVSVMACTIGYRTLVVARDDGRVIGYRAYTELNVGESRLVHARRGECGRRPPEWHEMEHELPDIEIGRFVDDGLGESQSDRCGGLTPARLVRFVAEKPGAEVFDLFQRKLKIVVRD